VGLGHVESVKEIVSVVGGERLAVEVADQVASHDVKRKPVLMDSIY
jgi:hypothetical protein